LIQALLEFICFENVSCASSDLAYTTALSTDFMYSDTLSEETENTTALPGDFVHSSTSGGGGGGGGDTLVHDAPHDVPQLKPHVLAT
jgi:hypothetical protein